MKLVIVSEFFYPYKTSTQKILTELAEDFVEYGLEVDVLTTKNAYREKKQKLSKYESYKGINIKRIFSTSGNRDNKLFRIVNYATFLSSLFINLLFKNDYHKILFVSNPPLAPYIGYLMKKLKGKEYVYLVHDVYPDVAEKIGVIKKTGFIYKLMDKINNKIYLNASKVIVLGRDMKQVIINKGIKEEKIKIITNWADKNNNFETKVSEEFYKKYNIRNKFNILYTGNISRVHAIDTIIEVARLLKDESGIKFTFVGDGNRKAYIEQLKKSEGLDNIDLNNYVFGEEYNNLLNCADVFISTLQKGIEGLGVPSKTYTYMSVAKPIIAIMSKESEIGNLVNENNLGKQFEGNEAIEIAKYIKELKNNENEYKKISDNVRKYFNDNYERKIVTNKFYNEIN